MLFKNQNILFVIAHPDDEWFLFEKLKSAKSAKILVLSTSTLHFEERKNETIQFIQKQKIKSISVEFLGDKKQFWDRDCLKHVDDLTNEIALAVKQQKPDLIITHDFENGHPDHDATFLATLRVSLNAQIHTFCFCSYRKGPLGLLTFFNPLTSTSNFSMLNFTIIEFFRMFKQSQHYKVERLPMSVLGIVGLLSLFLRGGMRLRNAKEDLGVIQMPDQKSLCYTRYKKDISDYETALQVFFTSVR